MAHSRHVFLEKFSSGSPHGESILSRSGDLAVMHAHRSATLTKICTCRSMCIGTYLCICFNPVH